MDMSTTPEMFRDVYCTCGKKLGTQTKYYGQDTFSFDEREKADYQFCPYCGKELVMF